MKPAALRGLLGAGLVVGVGVMGCGGGSGSSQGSSSTFSSSVSSSVAVGSSEPSSPVSSSSSSVGGSGSSLPPELASLPTMVLPGGVTIPSLPPIYGYGDFSAYSALSVPVDETTRLLYECLVDHGVSVEMDSPISILYTGTEEQAIWLAVYEAACWAGLRVPDEDQLTSQDVEVVFGFYLEQARCLEELGYEIPDPPAKEVWVESYPAVEWVPYRFVPESVVQRLDELCVPSWEYLKSEGG